MKKVLLPICFLLTAVAAYAHCGSCGPDHGKDKAAEVKKSCCGEEGKCCKEKKSCDKEGKSCNKEGKKSCGEKKSCDKEGKKSCGEKKSCDKKSSDKKEG